MATPLFSIGGLSSGLDTASIISQLMALERQPVVRFQQRQAELRQVDDAWGQVNTRLSAVRSALDALKGSAPLASLTTATSSVPTAVSATANGTATVGRTSFTVDQLAAAHQVTAGDSFATADALVGSGTFTLTGVDGTQLVSVATDGTTTLQGLANQVNAAGSGVSAQVLKVADGDYRLTLTAKETGAQQAFSVSSAPASLATAVVRTQGVDAKLSLGSLQVTRSSNTVDDLVSGVTLQLLATSASPVTIDVAGDTEEGVARVKKLLDAVNGALSTLKELSKYDPVAKKAGVLQGDSTVRQLSDDLRSLVTSPYANGSARDLGISIDRYGALTLDETALRTAITQDVAAVDRLFVHGGSATAGLRFVSGPASADGDHEVVISQASSAAAVTGATYARDNAADRTLTITLDGRAIQVTVASSSSRAQAVTQINDQLAQAGVSTLTASVDGTALRLKESRHGSQIAFEVSGSGSWGLDNPAGSPYRGTDVAGTIDGVAATGSGRLLTAADGLTVEVSDGTTSGTVSVQAGLYGVMDEAMRLAEGRDGLVQRARDALSSQIRGIDDRIVAFEFRLEGREQTLRQKFGGLETALARLQSQGSWLAGQLGLNQA